MISITNNSLRSNKLTIEKDTSFLNYNSEITHYQLELSKVLTDDTISFHKDIHCIANTEKGINNLKCDYFDKIETRLDKMISSVSVLFDQWLLQLDARLMEFSDNNEKLLFLLQNKEITDHYLKNKYSYNHYKEIPSYNSFFSDLKLSFLSISSYPDPSKAVIALNQLTPILPFSNGISDNINRWYDNKKTVFSISDIELMRENLISLYNMVKKMKYQIIEYIYSFISSTSALSRTDDCFKTPITCNIINFISPAIDYLKILFVTSFQIVDDYDEVFKNIVTDLNGRW